MNPSPPPPNTFSENVNTLPSWSRHLLQNVNMIEDEDDLCEMLQNNETMYFVLDGGATDGRGYFRWVIAT
eukprot:12072421-Ditylum_brightwellii.AAC.1